MPAWLVTLGWAVLKASLILGFVLFNALFLVWWERKFAARIQSRVGPQRTGRPFGYLQSMADVFKLLSKEDVVPARVDRWMYVLAPIVIFVPAVLVYVVVPFGPNLIVQDLNIGILYVAAVTSFTMIAIVMAGWAANNKYSVVSAMRAAAQLVAYEVPLVLAVIGPVMLAGTLSLQGIVRAQEGLWYIVVQPLGFLVFLTAGMAELNRAPFDLSEAESELVAGYNIEYSGMRWSFFFLAEFSNLVAVSAIATTLFLGGWQAPWFLPAAVKGLIPPVVWFLAKTYFLVTVIMWIRWTLPRVRIDQLLDFGWKFLLPVSLANIALTGLLFPVLVRLGWI